jgi:hypothetical protein
MKKETRGGKRSNSGRKPVKDKKTQLSVYIRQSTIDLNGGAEEIKKQIHNLIIKK